MGTQIQRLPEANGRARNLAGRRGPAAGSDRAPKQRATRLEAERLHQLLEIAADTFIAHGFESASTNEIARQANASKTTFYSRFPTKEILFSAVIEHRMDEVFQKISPTLPLDIPVKKALREFAMTIVRAALSPMQVGLIRMMSMESRRFPELGQRFYEFGAGRGKNLLAGFLTEQTRCGKFREADDPELMAEHFISLVIGGPVHWYVLGFRSSMLQGQERARHVDAAVSTFLRAYSVCS